MTTTISGSSGVSAVQGPGILGTVSQSGGVPTGAIIEKGSNANGEYTKWADGTMICTRSLSVAGVAMSLVNTPIYVTAVLGPIAFAAPFIVPPVVIHSIASNVSAMWVGYGSSVATATASQQFYGITYSATATNITIFQTAIGRWF